MSPALIARPHLELGRHPIAMEELTEDITRQHADLPRLTTFLRTAQATGVRTRYFTRPLYAQTVAGDATFEDRNRAAYGDALEMAVRAVPGALDNAGLALEDIDCVITSHATSWTAPSLDTDLVRLLGPQGLRPDIARIPLGTYACAGGAQALAQAHEHIAAHPGAHVLVVVAECLSAATYNPVDTSLESMIYKVLFGDSAVACVVSGQDSVHGAGPRFRIDDAWQYVLPDTRTVFEGRLDSYGLHFDSTREATRTIGTVAPALREWLDRKGSQFAPDFCVVHAGGPAILHHAQSALRVDNGPDGEPRTGPLRHSWDSLEQSGNLGGASVLDVLRRSFDDPAAGDQGVLLGYGPGITVAACKLTRT
ncbi:PhlD [Streptomyces sp. NPDC087300]|uniref:PhlD n=1 Tax=Streptomyces sp. NPDC087300 TaxID=3365780 RepID=UPI00380204CB